MGASTVVLEPISISQTVIFGSNWKFFVVSLFILFSYSVLVGGYTYLGIPHPAVQSVQIIQASAPSTSRHYKAPLSP